MKTHLSLKGLESPSKTNYRTYRFTLKEWIFFTAEGFAIIAAIDYLFYKEILALIPLAVFIPFFLKQKKVAAAMKRQRELTLDFRQALNSISVSLRAGHSVENAFRQSEEHLKSTLSKNSPMLKEIARINAGISVNVPVEELLSDLATRSASEDIQSFAEVFASAKRMGGNLPAIISSTASHIEGRIEVSREVDAAIAAKKFEQKIMSLMPFLIILYINLTSGDFLSPLYGNLLGIIVMSICLMIYAAAYGLGAKIVDIEV